MNRNPLVRTLLGCALLSLAGLQAEATSVLKLNVRELSVRSDLVFAGTVTSIEEIAVADGTMAYTFVTLGELDVLAGQYDQSFITLRFDGGALANGELIVVPGMPRFESGQRVVLFTRCENGSVPCAITGWGQGVLRVVEQPGLEPTVADQSGSPIHGIMKQDFVKSPSTGPVDEDVMGLGSDHEIRIAKGISAEDEVESGDAPLSQVESVPADFQAKSLTVAELRSTVLEVRSRLAGRIDSARVVRSADPSELPATGVEIPLPAPAPRQTTPR